MATPDLDVIKEIPGYKVILKAVLKAQIQQLVEQLALHTEEESVILTASVSDGTLCHLGSESGKVFLEDHDEIKSQFLGFCLKRQHRKKQKEKEEAAQAAAAAAQAAAQRSAPPPPGRFGPGYGPRPRGATSPRHQFSPTRFQSSPRQSFPQGQSPHPVSLQRASPQGGPVRSSPYPVNRPIRRPSFDITGAGGPRLARPMRLPVASGNGNVIKIEAGDDSPDMEGDKTKTESDTLTGAEGSGLTGAEGSGLPSSSQPSPSQITPSTPQPTEFTNDDSSSSTIPNEQSELKLPEGLSLDSDLSNLISESDAGKSSSDSNIPPGTPQSGGSGSAPPTPGAGTSNMAPNVNVKVEAITESEMDLEITGVEPGWVPNVQNRMGAFNPSTSGDVGDQGDMPVDQSGQDYSIQTGKKRKADADADTAGQFDDVESVSEPPLKAQKVDDHKSAPVPTEIEHYLPTAQKMGIYSPCKTSTANATLQCSTELVTKSVHSEIHKVEEKSLATAVSETKPLPYTGICTEVIRSATKFATSIVAKTSIVPSIMSLTGPLHSTVKPIPTVVSKPTTLRSTLSEVKPLPYIVSKPTTLHSTLSEVKPLPSVVSKPTTLRSTLSEIKPLPSVVSKPTTLRFTLSEIKPLPSVVSKPTTLRSTLSEVKPIPSVVSEPTNLRSTLSVVKPLPSAITDANFLPSAADVSLMAKCNTSTVSEAKPLTSTLSQVTPVTFNTADSRSLAYTEPEPKTLPSTISRINVPRFVTSTLSDAKPLTPVSLALKVFEANPQSCVVSETTISTSTVFVGQSLPSTLSNANKVPSTMTKAGSAPSAAPETEGQLVQPQQSTMIEAASSELKSVPSRDYQAPSPESMDESDQYADAPDYVSEMENTDELNTYMGVPASCSGPSPSNVVSSVGEQVQVDTNNGIDKPLDPSGIIEGNVVSSTVLQPLSASAESKAIATTHKIVSASDPNIPENVHAPAVTSDTNTEKTIVTAGDANLASQITSEPGIVVSKSSNDLSITQSTPITTASDKQNTDKTLARKSDEVLSVDLAGKAQVSVEVSDSNKQPLPTTTGCHSNIPLYVIIHQVATDKTDANLVNKVISENTQATADQNKVAKEVVPTDPVTQTETPPIPKLSSKQTSTVPVRKVDDVVLVNVTAEEKLYLPPSILPSPRNLQQTRTLAQSRKLTGEMTLQGIVPTVQRQTVSGFQNIARTDGGNIQMRNPGVSHRELTPKKASDSEDVICISDDLTYVNRTPASGQRQVPAGKITHRVPSLERTSSKGRSEFKDVICISDDVTYIDKSSRRISITPIKSTPQQQQRIQPFSPSQKTAQPQYHQSKQDEYLQYTPTKQAAQRQYSNVQAGSPYSRDTASNLEMYDEQYTPTKQISQPQYATHQATTPRQGPQQEFAQQRSPVDEWDPYRDPPMQQRSQSQHLFTPPKNIPRPQLSAQQRYITPTKLTASPVSRIQDEGVEIVHITPPKSKMSLFSSNPNRPLAPMGQPAVQQFTSPRREQISSQISTQQQRLGAEGMLPAKQTSQVIDSAEMQRRDSRGATGQIQVERSQTVATLSNIPADVSKMRPETLQQFIVMQRQALQNQSQISSQQPSRVAETFQVRPITLSKTSEAPGLQRQPQTVTYQVQPTNQASNQQRQSQIIVAEGKQIPPSQPPSADQQPSRVAETFQIKPIVVSAFSLSQDQPAQLHVATAPLTRVTETVQVQQVALSAANTVSTSQQPQIPSQQPTGSAGTLSATQTGASVPNPVSQVSLFVPIKREAMSPVKETTSICIPTAMPASLTLPPVSSAANAVPQKTALQKSMALVMSDVAVQQEAYRHPDPPTTQVAGVTIKQEPTQETATTTSDDKEAQQKNDQPTTISKTAETAQVPQQTVNVTSTNLPSTSGRPKRQKKVNEVHGVSIEIDNALQGVSGTPRKVGPEGIIPPFSPQQTARPFSPQSRRPSHELRIHTEPDTSGRPLASPEPTPHSSTSSDAGTTSKTGKAKSKRGKKSKSAASPNPLAFACSSCDKTFFSKSGLLRHAKKHKTDKPFNCDICGKGCSTKGGLKVHINSHFKTKDKN